MAVKIRFKRVGRKNLPSFRLVACDERAPRDGRTLEVLGHYDPLIADAGKRFLVQEDRVRYWLSVGARPTDSARHFLKERGILVPASPRERARRAARKRGRSGRAREDKPAAKKVRRKKPATKG